MTQFQRTDAVNCFTSGLSYILSLSSPSVIREIDILRCGSGFQFQSSYDEYGYPEYIFEVLPTCHHAVDRFGAKLVKNSLRPDSDDLDHLPELIKECGPLLIWVNSKFMYHTEVYARRDGYIHAIVLKDYHAGTRTYSMYDPLIVDRVPVSCHTEISHDVLKLAATTLVHGNELAPEMGTLYFVEQPSSACVPNTLGEDLSRQAWANLTDPQHRDAISIYHQSCMKFMAHGNLSRTRAARRLFDHISPLFVLPSIYHLKGALNQLLPDPSIKAKLNDLEHLWREMAILALKYEASDSAMVLDRIDTKFQLINDRNRSFWASLIESIRQKSEVSHEQHAAI